MISDLVHMVFLFFIVIDALGNVPIFLGMLHRYPPVRQRQIILRELLLALACMVFFLFFGKEFFTLLHISSSSLQIAGGIILLLIAIQMIFANPRLEEHEKKSTKEPLLVPLAIPAIAGPGILATITLFGGGGYNKCVILFALVLAWFLSLPILLFSSYIKVWLGENGITAVERLFGYLLVLISGQMILSGLQLALHR